MSMPKLNKKKNGYMLYMDSRRAEFVAAGHSGSYPELVQLCAQGWEELPEDQKLKFRDKAKYYNEQVKLDKIAPRMPAPLQPRLPQENDDIKPDLVALGGEGENATEVMQRQKNLESTIDNIPLCVPREDRIQMEKNRKLVTNLVDNPLKMDWKSSPIVICSFTFCVKPGLVGYKTLYLPAEIGLTAVSLKDGVIDNFARLIDPGPIPAEFEKEAAENVTKLGIPKIGSTPELTNYVGLVEALIRFLRKYNGETSEDEVNVFCLDRDYMKVSRCLDWLTKKADGLYIPIIRVLSLDLYGFSASSCSTIKDFERCIQDVEPFKNFKEICCIHHMMGGEGVEYCALKTSNRSAFNLLKALARNNQVAAQAGRHYPEIDDPASEKRRRIGMLQQWGITRMEKEKIEKQDESVQSIDWRVEVNQGFSGRGRGRGRPQKSQDNATQDVAERRVGGRGFGSSY